LFEILAKVRKILMLSSKENFNPEMFTILLSFKSVYIVQEGLGKISENPAR
jgi:hypothetical protein